MRLRFLGRLAQVASEETPAPRGAASSGPTREQMSELEMLGERILQMQARGAIIPAIELSEYANALAREYLGQRHAMLAGGLSSLAYLYLQVGNPERAEDLLIETLSITRDIKGHNEPLWHLTLERLIMVYQVIWSRTAS